MDFKGKEYPEINNIHDFITNYQVFINKTTTKWIDKRLIPVELKLGGIMYLVQIFDEYKDLNFNNTLLNFILVFRELELINDSTDYLDWCKQQGLKANNDQLRNYYTDIVKVLPEIVEYFPNKKITSFISDIDFQLNAGTIQLLRN